MFSSSLRATSFLMSGLKMDGATAGEGGEAGPNYDDSDSEDEVRAPGRVCLQSIFFCVGAGIQ